MMYEVFIAWFESFFGIFAAIFFLKYYDLFENILNTDSDTQLIFSSLCSTIFTCYLLNLCMVKIIG